MNKNKVWLTCSVIAGLCLCAGGANAKSVYANSGNVININMLTEQMMSYAHYGENISDFMGTKYGTMTRVDEYGDDGKNAKAKSKKEDSLGKAFWVDVKYLNTAVDYSDDVSNRARIYMGTIGLASKNIDVTEGALSFGAFLGNITSDDFGFTASGFNFGAFSRYKYENMEVVAAVNNGSLSKSSDTSEFSDSWVNLAIDASLNIHVTDTLYIRPKVYYGYNKISAETMRFGDNVVPGHGYEFVNFAPSLEVFTRLNKNLYMSVLGKYVNVDGAISQDVYANGVFMDTLSAQKYYELGVKMEYNYKDYVFTGEINKQLAGFDGLGFDLNAKYIF